MANFCGKCGTALDKDTGLCPKCDSQKTVENVESSIAGLDDMDLTATIAVNRPVKTAAPEPQIQPAREEKNPQSFTKTSQKAKNTKPSAAKTVITVLLAILLFITSFASITIYNVRAFVSEDNIEEMLDSIKMSKLVDDGSRLENFYDFLREDYGIYINESELNNFIEESSIIDFAADKVADFSEDLFAGDNAEIKIDEEEVLNLINEDIELIMQEFGVSLTYTQREEIADWIISDEEVVIFDSDDFENDLPWLYYTLKVMFSYTMLAVFIVMSLLLIAAMAKNSMSQAVCATGTVFIIHGALALVAIVLKAAITTAFEAVISVGNMNSVVDTVVTRFIETGTVIGIVLLVLGIILFILNRFLLNRKRNTD